MKRIFAAIAMAVVASFTHAASTYSVQLIAGEDGVSGSFRPLALSPTAGLIAGYSSIAGDRMPHNAVWQQGTLNPLRAHRKDEMRPIAVNDRGIVAGTRSTSDLTGYTAMYWSRDGRAHALSPLTPGDETNGVGISKSGDVGGVEFSASDWIPVIWHRGVPARQPIPKGLSRAIPYAMSPGGLMAGRGTDRLEQDWAVLWSKGKATLVGPQPPAFGLAVNDRGQVVGEAGSQPFIATADAWRLLPLLSSHLGGSAASIDSGGNVVGYSVSDDSKTVAVRWVAGGVAEDLNTLLDSEAIAAGWVVYRALSIDDTGRILVVASQPGGSWMDVILVPSGS